MCRIKLNTERLEGYFAQSESISNAIAAIILRTVKSCKTSVPDFQVERKWTKNRKKYFKINEPDDAYLHLY